MTSNSELPPNAIAVVGMAARLPGANTLSAFWDNLRRGEESIVTYRKTIFWPRASARRRWRITRMCGARHYWTASMNSTPISSASLHTPHA